jgi:hypothetical protein
VDLTWRRVGTLIGAALLLMFRIDGVGHNRTEVDRQHSPAMFDNWHRDTGSLKLPGPDAQRELLGSWSINAESQHGEKTLGSGMGTELWYPGPGGNSLIEELHIADPEGRPVDAFGPAWWDQEARGQRFLWCTNNLPQGCVLSGKVMRWEGDRYVYREDRKSAGKIALREEVFSEITDHSFLQTISAGSVKAKLTPTWIAKANKLDADLPRLSFPALPIGLSSNISPQIAELICALVGTWSIQLAFSPSQNMFTGASGTGEEVWHPGPGGLSLIEEYHSIGADGEVSGLGIFWPDKRPLTMKVLWCESANANGCAVMKGGAKWERNQIVIEDESEWGGKKMMFREVFSAITKDSFLQTVYKGEFVGDLKKLLTISATRTTPVAEQAGSGRCEPRFAHFTRDKVSFAPGLISSICSKKENRRRGELNGTAN